MSQPDVLKNANSVKELQGKTGQVEYEIKSLTSEWESIYEQLLSED